MYISLLGLINNPQASDIAYSVMRLVTCFGTLLTLAGRNIKQVDPSRPVP
ncbi:hypothetical protein F2Q69_00054441 [Brassica cretica]|uniref:Uncharacterized protein n=1 Tax=Brassica cretica TaxID=69181 RepID=A0A8S9N4U2_BRACR|nr:hypothetical protein F2Q69_00054441 [Brassica cretica]